MAYHLMEEPFKLEEEIVSGQLGSTALEGVLPLVEVSLPIAEEQLLEVLEREVQFEAVAFIVEFEVSAIETLKLG